MFLHFTHLSPYVSPVALRHLFIIPTNDSKDSRHSGVRFRLSSLAWLTGQGRCAILTPFTHVHHRLLRKGAVKQPICRATGGLQSVPPRWNVPVMFRRSGEAVARGVIGRCLGSVSPSSFLVPPFSNYNHVINNNYTQLNYTHSLNLLTSLTHQNRHFYHILHIIKFMSSTHH